MPVDHEYFTNTSAAQWLWYNYQDVKDQDDRIVDARDMLEYHASFIEPEVVNKLVESRNKKNASEQAKITAGTTDDAVFNEGIKRMFGRDPGIVNTAMSGEMGEISDVLDHVAEYHKRQVIEASLDTLYNYKYWAEMELE